MRVVVLSSMGHSFGNIDLEDLHFTKGRSYTPWVSYGQSKMANILFAKELNKRANGAYIAVSVHPGGIDTNLMQHTPNWQVAIFRAIVAMGLTKYVLG